LRIARAGGHVMVADVDGASARATARAVIDAGGDAEVAEFDIANPAAHEAAVAQAVASWGQLDGAFNSGGIGGPLYAKMLDMDIAAWQQTLSVNLSGLWYAVRAQVAQMREQQNGGSIVNTASVASVEGRGGNAAYTTPKHAILALTRSVAEEYAESNVRVNAICPGWPEAPASAAAALRLRAVYSGGQGEDEAGAAIVWLMSNAASFMTGATLPVDVGQAARM